MKYLKLGNIVIVIGFLILLIAGGYVIGALSKEVYLVLRFLAGILIVAGLAINAFKK